MNAKIRMILPILIALLVVAIMTLGILGILNPTALNLALLAAGIIFLVDLIVRMKKNIK